MKKITIILAMAFIALQANSFTITDKAKVTHSKPIYKTVIKRAPYQECWDEEVPVRRYDNSYEKNSNPLGIIIGSVAGGIIGHQVGKGRGKDFATVGGALIGTVVGHNLSQRGHKRRNSYRDYDTVQRCETKYTKSSMEKFVGYKNIAYYNGKKIVKRSQRKLRYIPINITIHY